MSIKFIFVHGLSGWGSYDSQYKYMPYWGMRGGDLIAYLRKLKFDCYAASVAPKGSAWDRACELYAQLAGMVTDYGKEHSKRCGHERFGPDFTGRALIDCFDDSTKLVLIGHSFGGATVRLLSELMANGSTAEQAASDGEEISRLFLGGMAGRIHSIVTLAAPTNGTTAYDMTKDVNFDPDDVKVSMYEDFLDRMRTSGTGMKDDGRLWFDNAAYDMHIDNAIALNRKIETLKNVYYFSVPCSKEPEKVEAMFRKTARQMAKYRGVTRGGIKLDELWQENDGLVNTISATAPIGAPAVEYDKGAVKPGVWNVMPVYHGDHMSLQGGLTRLNDVRKFYFDLLYMIKALPVA